MNLIEKIKQFKIIPVVIIENASNAVQLTEALSSAGLPCAEVTLRTDAALNVIEEMSRIEDFVVGAGTVLTVEEAAAVKKAGANFIVSPGFNPKVVSWCLENDMPIYPGVSNPTDIEMALDFGLEVLKFFPAEAFGGIKTIKALASAYQKVSFMPTGGINMQNISDYLKHPQVVACGGSWMVKPEWIQNGSFDMIKAETQKAMQLIQSIS